MDFKNKASLRIVFVGAAFLIICIVYIARMIGIASDTEATTIQVGTYEREVAIQAVRGEIYDRNGKKLVYNTYTYDMVFDYNAMAATQLERNYDILIATNALEETGNSSHRTESSFPFDGSYPNYTYTSEALDTDSNIYYRLLKRIAENELEDNSEKPKNELTVSYLAEFYAAHPEEFPSESELVEWYLYRYKIDSTDDSGSPLFTDSEIDKILRMRYDMEVNDFSIYTQYKVATDLDISFITYIEELELVGADFIIETSRQYAYPGYASHILGQTGKIPEELWEHYKNLGYEMNDTVGLSGCEEAFEEYLRGEDGIMIITEDLDGNIIDSRIAKEPIAGKDVYLTIDIDLQISAEKGLERNVSVIGDARAGALVAQNPNNGEILALASYPSYDLTTYNEDYSSLIRDPANPLYNRALDGLYAPGSTFKVGMVAAGISHGTFNASTTVDCNGKYTYYDDYQPECWIYPGMHGKVNAAYALQVSCNCYFYELGRLLGIDTMNEYCTGYGLGQHTGIELGDKQGILAGPNYRDENGLLGWTAGNTIAAAIGQSDNTFTPIQISNYISTVLNGGTRYSMHLLLEVREYGSGKVVYQSSATVAGSVLLSSEAVSAAKQGMRQMVENDVAVTTYMQDVPVKVGGKTGTAQRGKNKNDNRLFVCAAPYNDPEIVICSVIEPDDNISKDGAHGSSYACIAASYVLEEYYH